jgi:hypothetical protein
VGGKKGVFLVLFLFYYYYFFLVLFLKTRVWAGEGNSTLKNYMGGGGERNT